MKLFDLLADWSEPFAKEWFQLMEWLLIIGALSAAAKFSAKPAIQLLPILSIVLLYLYVLFGYLGRYLRGLPGKSPRPPIWRTVLLSAVFLLSVFYFSSVIGGAALEFATRLAGKG